jgi:hypothetical protein
MSFYDGIGTSGDKEKGKVEVKNVCLATELDLEQKLNVKSEPINLDPQHTYNAFYLLVGFEIIPDPNLQITPNPSGSTTLVSFLNVVLI